MSFNYEKNKNEDSHSQWTSYSDLFMGLSFVFLLLYVTASLRSGTVGMQQQLQTRKVAMENDDLKNQLKVYDSLKKEYLATDASADEAKMYEDLMGKLDLLQDQAKSEKEKLALESGENAKKEVALNKYQQMIRNIMNSNAIAKARIKKRNTVIEAQDEEIVLQDSQIEDLEQTVEDKKTQIAQREKQIEGMNQNLDKKVKQLQSAYKQNQMSKKAYQAEMAKTQGAHEKRMADLKNQQAQAEQQLDQMNGQLAATQGELQKTAGLLQQKEGETKALAQKLGDAEAGYADQVAKMQGAFEAQRGKDRAAFDGEMNRQKLGAADRAAKEAAFRAGAAKKEREFGDKIAGLKNQLTGTEGELAKAKAEIDARRNVAKEIQEGFRQAGIKAEVDGETGDVTLDFGDHYFDTGRADIKKEMAQILKKAMPIYSKSLMENKKVAGKINSIEIVGFASPTYQGRVIDPKSMSPDDRKAAEYNMDLSYQRARSIYSFVFDQSQMNFKHQKDVRPMVKVSGKSFFDDKKVSRNIASTDFKSVAEFCKKYDCKKSQRVLIKFNVDPK